MGTFEHVQSAQWLNTAKLHTHPAVFLGYGSLVFPLECEKVSCSRAPPI